MRTSKGSEQRGPILPTWVPPQNEKPVRSSLRVLLASDHFPPSVGGAQRQTRLLARHLARRGHDVEVVTSTQGSDAPRDEVEEGVRVRRLSQVRAVLDVRRAKPARHQPPFPDPVTVWQLRRIVKRFRPDIVHSYGWFTSSVLAALAGSDIPLVVSARDYSCSCPKQTLLFQGGACTGPSLPKCIACCGEHFGKIKGAVTASAIRSTAAGLGRRIDGLHSVSTYVEQMMKRDFLDDRGSHAAIPLAVIPSFGEYATRERSLAARQLETRYAEGAPYMLFVGALRREKGIAELLAAYRSLRDAPKLLLVGTVERDTPRSLPEGVVLVGEVSHDAVMGLWDGCLFGVLPSIFPEPLGSVVHEGMSRGKAVIGTRPGGHTDMIVDGETGVLVPAGDVVALRQAMQRLMDDEPFRTRLGDAARVRSERFSADVVVPQFEDFYYRVIRERSRR
jgi:glycosyltransferase involved in cell wall biosynthesis